MKTLPCLLVLVHIALGQQLFGRSPNIAELQPGEYEDRILKSPAKKAWLVDCYAHWCGHCKRFVPVWEKVAGNFANDDRIKFGAINCAKHSAFCSKLGVKSYPSLRAYNFPILKGSEGLPGAAPDKSPNVGKMMDIVKNLVKGLPVTNKTLGLSNDLPQQSPQAPLASLPTSVAILVTTMSQMHDVKTPDELIGLRLIDAEVALVYSLHQAAFLAASEQPSSAPPETGESRGHGRPAIVGETLQELIRWLEFLAAVFPSQKASASLLSLARFARLQMESHASLGRDEWLKVLSKSVIERVQATAGDDPSPHFRLCATYTCGLWTLFHILAISVAEFKPRVFLASAGSHVAIPSPTEFMARIRGFVANFFGCEMCVTHFLKMFDSCEFGRCIPAANNSRGVVLWLWRAHNEVTKRVSKESGSIVGPWPSEADCGTCRFTDSVSIGREVGDDVSWNALAVYQHLKLYFWQPGSVISGHTIASSSDVAWQLFILAVASTGLVYLAWLKMSGTCRRSKHGRKRC